MVAEASEWDQFCRNLGSALAQWQQVELALFDVFHKVAGAKNRHVASAIFFAVRGFEGKLRMTVAGAKLALEGTKFSAEWHRLADRIATSKTLRNHLAHFQMNEEATRNQKAKYRLRLTPNFSDATQSVRYAEDSPPSYDLEQIRRFGDQFSALATDLTAFAEKLP